MLDHSFPSKRQPDLKYFFIPFPSQMQVEFDKLDRQARQLSDQLAEVTKQKKAAAAASKDDHPPSSSSSSSSSSSASSKKSTSSEYRDIIHQLEGKLSMTRGEQAKLEKDNQRLKNSITVCNTHIHPPFPHMSMLLLFLSVVSNFQAAEQRVKDCLHDQMLLHHQIQVLEEEALSSKAAITRLTRELEDRKFLRSGREDKDRSILPHNQ